MSSKNWIGGASLTAQISTITLNNDANDAETLLTVTLTNEGGGTQAETVVPTGVDETVIAAALQAVLAASTQSLFTAVTWTVATSVVTGTAKIAGVPFYFSSAYTAGTGTTTDATGTANSGPNSWDVAANFNPATVPVDDDDMRFNEGAYDVLYGLDQSGVDLKSLRVMPGYTGSIGQPSQGYYLRIDVASTTGGNSPKVNINKIRGNVWLKGSITRAYVVGCPVGLDSVRFATTVSTLHIIGPNVRGRVFVADSTALATVFMLDCPGATLWVGESVSGFTTHYQNAGIADLNSAVTTVHAIGGTCRHWAGAVTTFNGYGASCEYNGSGTLTLGNQYGGKFDFVNNDATAVTVTNANVYSGLWTDQEGTVNVTYTNSIAHFGGTILTRTGTINNRAA